MSPKPKLKKVINEELGRCIRTRREAQRMTQEELASKAGVSQQYLSDVENGKRSYSIAVFYCIAISLGTTPEEIWQDFSGDAHSKAAEFLQPEE